MDAEHEKLTTLKDLVKDVKLISEYFEDPEAVIERVSSLSSEVARIAYLKEIIKKVIEMKTDFVKEAVKLEGQINKVNTAMDEVLKDREEIRKEINAARMTTRGLTHQLLKITEIMQKGNLQPEIIRRLTNYTKEYVAKCPSCSREKRGSVEEIAGLNQCRACNKDYELFTLYQVE